MMKFPKWMVCVTSGVTMLGCALSPGDEAELEAETQDELAGAAARCGCARWTFDRDLESAFLGDSEPAELTLASTLLWDPKLGSPRPGSAHASIPFTSFGQWQAVAIPTGASLDLRANRLTVRVLTQGLTRDPSAPGGGKLFAKSGDDYVFAAGPWTNVTDGEWTTFTLSTANPDWVDAGFDARDIREIGLYVQPGGDAQTPNGTVELHVDTFDCAPTPMRKR
jgi:hypothetical protein